MNAGTLRCRSCGQTFPPGTTSAHDCPGMVINRRDARPTPIVLECGHVAAERERFRGDVRDFWCSFCLAWKRKAAAVALDRMTVPDDHRIDRAREILADHARGWHDNYDTDQGCTYVGCDDAFWLVSRIADQ